MGIKKFISNMMSSCSDKRKYKSKKEAMYFLNKCNDYQWVSLRPYNCSLCKGWHLTSK